MRASFALSLLVGAAVGSTAVSLPASADSWHQPQVFEDTNGSYTNYKYDDGLCQYYYSYNNFDRHAQVNRYGDCDHLVIGPDGHVMPMDPEGAPPE